MYDNRFQSVILGMQMCVLQTSTNAKVGPRKSKF